MKVRRVQGVDALKHARPHETTLVFRASGGESGILAQVPQDVNQPEWTATWLIENWV